MLAACGLFDRGDEEDTEDSIGEGEDSDWEPPPEGLHVYPKFALQDVQAVVTIEPDLNPQLCPPDPVEGGYLCAVDSIVSATALLRVERDGFETALREPTIVQNAVERLDVHLAPQGGAPGTWSNCAAVGTHTTCDDLCQAQAQSCSPAGCATGNGDWPLATAEGFADPACSSPALESTATPCDDPLPVGGGGVEAVRCCCIQ